MANNRFDEICFFFCFYRVVKAFFESLARGVVGGPLKTEIPLGGAAIFIYFFFLTKISLEITLNIQMFVSRRREKLLTFLISMFTAVVSFSYP